MLGFNWVDAIIVLLLIAAMVEGVRIGATTLSFVIVAFFGALFAAGWAVPHILPLPHGHMRTIVNILLVLGLATLAGFGGFDLGQRVHWSFRTGRRLSAHTLKRLETISGIIPALAAGLVLVWLLGVAIGRLPFVGFSNSVSDARIVQFLSLTLPPVPAVFARLDSTVNPNAEPYVAAQPKPAVGFDYSPEAVQAAETKSAGSVVRITSYGCGGIVSGTGFAVAPDIVATNAHVIAGVKRSIVKYRGNSYETTPVWFNASLDLAMLHVERLPAPTLKLMPKNASLGSTVAVLGYPGGNYHVVPGILRDTLAVSANDIYDQNSFGRGIYEIQTDVAFGSSGSPVVLADGQVAGIIFSKSTGTAGYAYALTSPHIQSALQSAKTSHRRVSTGACMVN